MIVSVTSLSSYLYCARKLFLTKVLRLVEMPKEVLVKGSIRHETYDKINKNEEALVKGIKKKPTFESLALMYEKECTKFLKEAMTQYNQDLKNLNLDQKQIFNQIRPYFTRESKTRALNLFNFIKKENLFGEELWQSLTPKINSEVKALSKYLQLRGIIDQIEVWDNRFVPVELKTGKMPQEGVWPGHRIQLACYAMLLEEKHNQRIKYGYVNYLDHDEKRVVKINPFLRAEVNELVKKVQFLMKSKETPEKCKNQNKCNACGLREKCFNEELIKSLLTGAETKTLNITCPIQTL